MADVGGILIAMLGGAAQERVHFERERISMLRKQSLAQLNARSGTMSAGDMNAFGAAARALRNAPEDWEHRDSLERALATGNPQDVGLMVRLLEPELKALDAHTQREFADVLSPPEPRAEKIETEIMNSRRKFINDLDDILPDGTHTSVRVSMSALANDFQIQAMAAARESGQINTVEDVNRLYTEMFNFLSQDRDFRSGTIDRHSTVPAKLEEFLKKQGLSAEEVPAPGAGVDLPGLLRGAGPAESPEPEAPAPSSFRFGSSDLDMGTIEASLTPMEQAVASNEAMTTGVVGEMAGRVRAGEVNVQDRHPNRPPPAGVGERFFGEVADDPEATTAAMEELLNRLAANPGSARTRQALVELAMRMNPEATRAQIEQAIEQVLSGG